jgi:glutathione S-transferase
MTVKIYGISGSRAIRSLWAIEETGIEFEQVPVNFGKDSKTPEYLGVNPNGRIPTLQDGDLVLFESMAINMYLAKTYAPALYPDNPEDEARAMQWSVWAISEIEPLQMQIVIQKFFNRDNMDQSIIESATTSLQRPLKVLEEHLSGSSYLLGNDFTVADLNLSGVMLLLQGVQFDMSAYTHVSDWQNRCYAREALARAQALA